MQVAYTRLVAKTEQDLDGSSDDAFDVLGFDDDTGSIDEQSAEADDALDERLVDSIGQYAATSSSAVDDAASISVRRPSTTSTGRRRRRHR